MSNDKPGTDWQAKHDAAGTAANQAQHENWTTADGPVNQRPVSAEQERNMLNMINGETL
jgi:hypothetical protein